MRSSERWREMVEAEHAQSERARGSPPPDDHWKPYAQQFKADPDRSDDPLLNRLLEELKPHHTVIDVGAGAGRLALPLAHRCQHVTAVEPSPSMGSALIEQASDYAIRNVTLVQSRWEDAEVESADIVLCVHVLYSVKNIEGFLRKMEVHCRERILIVLYEAPPQSQIYSLWNRIHGVERLPLPSILELEEVLGELGIEAQLEAQAPQGVRGFDSLEQASAQLSQRLYLVPGSHEHSLLESLLPDLLEETDGVFRVRGAQPLKPVLVWWQPGGCPASPSTKC